MGKTDDTTAHLAGSSESKPLPLLVSDTLQGDEILVSWETVIRWGFLNFGPGVISSESSPSGTVFKGTGTGPVVLREENASFLASLPAMHTYEPIDPVDQELQLKHD